MINALYMNLWAPLMNTPPMLQNKLWPKQHSLINTIDCFFVFVLLFIVIQEENKFYSKYHLVIP